jgi:hypothetical protein
VEKLRFLSEKNGVEKEHSIFFYSNQKSMNYTAEQLHQAVWNPEIMFQMFVPDETKQTAYVREKEWER